MWIGGLQRVSRALFPNPNVRFATVQATSKLLHKPNLFLHLGVDIYMSLKTLRCGVSSFEWIETPVQVRIRPRT